MNSNNLFFNNMHMPDESYVYFNCKVCNALFSDTHWHPDYSNYVCDNCLDDDSE